MAHLRQTEFIALPIAVLSVSDTRSLATDDAGQTLVDRLHAAGHQLADRQLCIDNTYLLRAQLSQWIADPRIQVVLITGGTGFSAQDNTPQAVTPLLDKLMDGFGELFRQLSYADIGTSTVQSRALAGFANGTLICCLPGSPGACRTAWDGILEAQLDSRSKPCNVVPHLGSAETQALACCGTRA
ncbi:molybdenum cofactor biosynthesis protein B [Halopseudomonas pelagia]|uniref:molybdenum cofactor biosynthesis protein B n=1 Tax=Halopseudomonas pelagia TaxID=553151 RepID=UPI00039B082B|nr:molybdenum cofactor biosynthesis protein B [Halopseudomonas pelagia]|tara:strand:- start:506 stop:1060 length:555 start_codon:yes stop_codon:yes gene_type:complete